MNATENAPRPWRPIRASEARGMLQEAVRLNLIDRRHGGGTRFGRERDEIIGDLIDSGHPANVNDYSHPMDV